MLHNLSPTLSLLKPLLIFTMTPSWRKRSCSVKIKINLEPVGNLCTSTASTLQKTKSCPVLSPRSLPSNLSNLIFKNQVYIHLHVHVGLNVKWFILWLVLDKKKKKKTVSHSFLCFESAAFTEACSHVIRSATSWHLLEAPSLNQASWCNYEWVISIPPSPGGSDSREFNWKLPPCFLLIKFPLHG